MLRKISLFVIILAILIQSLPVAALNLESYQTEEELRQAIIGDEKWVENFPNGLFNFIGTQFKISENQEFLEIAIIRQGGTQGRVTVDFKAIDVSAEYGKDYVIRAYKNHKKNEIEKNEDAIPLIDTVGDNASLNISEAASDEVDSTGAETPSHTDGTIPDGATPDETTPDGTTPDETTPEEATPDEATPEEATPDKATPDEAAPDGIAPDETQSSTNISEDEVMSNQTEASFTDLPPTIVTVGEGSTQKPGSLREVRDTYLGEKSDRPDWKSLDEGKVEELKTEYDKFLYNMPGTQTTLEFGDGEYIKYLYLVPLNDSISESEEQVLFALQNPSNGACRGEFYMGYVNINDDEELEESLFEISTPSVISKDNVASVVVKRTGGLQQYASVLIGTEEGSAISGVDYEPGIEELFFTPGTSEQTVHVNVLSNIDRETSRQFTIALDRTSKQVNTNAAQAVITIPAEINPTETNSTSLIEKNRSALKSKSEIMSTFELLAAERKNINAEKITRYGYSENKGEWIISSFDYFAGSKSIHDLISANCTDGLQYDFRGVKTAGTAYPISSLGGVDTISFYHYNGGSGTCKSSFSLDRRNDFLRFIFKPKVNKYYKEFGKTFSGFHSTSTLDEAAWLNTEELVFTAYAGSGSKTTPYFGETKLKLKQYNLDILPSEKIQRRKYTINNSIISYDGIYPNNDDLGYDPGTIYVKSIHSNVGNYQDLPGDPKVYRSDRIEFGYAYSDENPNGKYSTFTGIQVKNGNNWISFDGTELVLNADFFNRSGILNAIRSGTIEVRPVFTKRKASFEIDINISNGYLTNASGIKVSNLSYSKTAQDTKYVQLYAGDVITNLKAQSTYSSKPPVWASVGGVNLATSAPNHDSVVVTEKEGNTEINYILQNDFNKLSLSFKDATLIVKAQPAIYNNGFTMLPYKLDGVAYTDRQAFTNAIITAYESSVKNPNLEMEFQYVFDPLYPDKAQQRYFGTPKKAYLNVYKMNGDLRKTYTVDINSNYFKFSYMPKEEGWEIDDFASIIIEGSGIDGGISPQTRETVIDFLANSRDGVLVIPPENGGSQAPWVGDIKEPIEIESTNPLLYYNMQAIASPGFITSWKDYSPDTNNDGQLDPFEKENIKNVVRKILDNPRLELKDILDEKLYWGNNFTYKPAYFNPSKIYYSFNKRKQEASQIGVWITLCEQYSTVLNPGALSDEIPIKDAEVYIGAKKILDGNGDGIYHDVDPIYKEGDYYLGQVIYGKQFFNFAVMGADSTKLVINISNLVMPKEFKATITEGSEQKNQNLNAVNNLLNIKDADTTFTYRLDASKVGLVLNDSIIRIYDFKGNLHSEARTGAPISGEFSYSINSYTEGITPGSYMTIAGVLANVDGDIITEYPEVQVGFAFYKELTSLTALASFETPIQPVVEIMGKLNNNYDLGMDINVEKGEFSEYTDSTGFTRKVKTISFGFSDEYVKKFGESAKDPEKGSDDVVKEESEDKNKNELDSMVKDAAKDAEKPQKSKGSGGGDFHMPYKISLVLTIQFGREKSGTENIIYRETGLKYFGSMVIMATATADYKYERTYMTPIGIPVTATISASGSASAVLAFESDHLDPYNSKYSLEGEGAVKLKPSNYEIYSKFIITPTVTLGVGAGFDFLNLEISGTAKFDFQFDLPITESSVSSAGSGTVVLDAKLKLKILFVQKSWTLYKSKPINLFSYGRMQETALSTLEDPYQNYLYEEVGVLGDEDIMPRNYLSDRGEWDSSTYNDDLLQGVYTATEDILLQGSFPNPQTELIQIGENESLMLFIDDDINRDGRNRAALMYSIIDGVSSTTPVTVDNDGTWDQAPDAFLVDNRVLVTWSDASRTLTNSDNEIDILNTMDISGVWFDLATKTFGDEFVITKTTDLGDNYSDLEPMISYDPSTKKLMVFYTKIDHNDRWTLGKYLSDPDLVPIEQTPNLLYGDIVNGYSVIAYRYAEFDEGLGDFVWNETYALDERLDSEKYYGQRFLELAPLAEINEEEIEILDETIVIEDGDDTTSVTLRHTGTNQTVMPYKGLEDPRISEMDLTTHDGNALIAYIMDYDSDLQTQQDQQLYLQSYSYGENKFSNPIEITNNDKQNTLPQFVNNNGITYLYWLQDGDMVYTSVNDILADGKLKEVMAPDDGRLFSIIDKTSTTKDAHINMAVEHSNPIEEYKIVSDNGSIYALWTEECISYKNGLQPGDEGTENPENINMERHIFAACNIPSETFDVQSFPWSNPIQITFDEAESFSDVSFVVTDTDKFLVSYARFNQQFDANAGCFTNTNSVRTLAVNEFIITNELELGEIAIDKERPLPGDKVEAAVDLTNTGLKPVEDYYYQFYAIINGELFYESQWYSNYDVDTSYYILGGKSTSLRESFIMPDTLDNVGDLRVGFRLKNEFDILLEQSESELLIKPDVQITVLKSKQTGRNSAYINLYLENIGNKDFDDVLTISDSDKILYSEQINIGVGEEKYFPQEVEINDAHFSELLTAEDGSKFDIMSLEIKLGESKVNAELKREISALNLEKLQDVQSFNITKDGKLLNDGDKITINEEDIDTLKSEIIKAEKKRLSPELEETIPSLIGITWDSSNPKIVSILPDGTLIPMSPGTAIVTAALLPVSKNAMAYMDGSFEMLDTSYQLPGSIAKQKSFVVSVEPTSGTGWDPGVETDNDNDDKIANDSISAQEKLEGDKLTLTLNEKLFAESVGRITNTLTIESSEQSQVKQMEIILTENNLNSIGDSKLNRLTINSVLGSISFDRKSMDYIKSASSGKAVSLILDYQNGVIEVTIMSGGKRIENIGDGAISVSVSHTPNDGENPNRIIVNQIYKKENKKIVRTSLYDAKTGKIVFKAFVPGRYEVGYNKVEFIDDLGWAKDYITFLSSRNIVVGTSPGVFDKDKIVTRAEFVSMLSRIVDVEQLEDMTTLFEDVDSNAWYANAVKWASDNKIVYGTTDKKFSPNNPISREEMATMVYRFMTHANIPIMQVDANEFMDNDKISNWAKIAVKAMKAENIMIGTGENNFEPKKMSSRAEAAKVITEIIKLWLK